MNNIVEFHISETQKRLRKYCSLILKSKYDRKVADELIQTYIDARYYNFDVNKEIKVFYRRIFDAVKTKAADLTKGNPEKKENIEDTLILFQYFFYFDYVRKNIEIEEVVKKIAEKRVSKFNLRSAENDDFEKTFLDLVQTDLNNIEEFIDSYDSPDFELDISKLTGKSNFYMTKLKYNFNFPEIFNKETIEETFNTDIIAEDKLFVEYPMVAIKALRDILDGNFTKVYMIDFSTDLLSKKKKLEQLLQILENQATQDKISFVITYREFTEYKNQIYKVMKRGFNFTLKTDKNMPKLAEDELKLFELFNCIIVDSYDINKKKYKKLNTIEV